MPLPTYGRGRPLSFCAVTWSAVERRAAIAARSGDVHRSTVVRVRRELVRARRGVERPPYRRVAPVTHPERSDELRRRRRAHRDYRREIRGHGCERAARAQGLVASGRDDQRPLARREVRDAVPRPPRRILLRIGSIEDAAEAQVHDRDALRARVRDGVEERTVERDDVIYRRARGSERDQRPCTTRSSATDRRRRRGCSDPRSRRWCPQRASRAARAFVHSRAVIRPDISLRVTTTSSSISASTPCRSASGRPSRRRR